LTFPFASSGLTMLASTVCAAQATGSCGLVRRQRDLYRLTKYGLEAFLWALVLTRLALDD